MATRETKLPSIPAVPDDLSEEMTAFLSAVKEKIEIREGRANDLDKVLLRRDLSKIGIDVNSLIQDPGSYSLNNLIPSDTDDHYAKFTPTGLSKKTFAEVLVDLSGEAGAAFDFNSKNLTNVGTIGLVGGQIAFPATAVPSADANTQDDYEEGNWTAAGKLSTAGNSSNASQVGRYTKIGNKVFAEGGFAFTKGTGTGTFTLTGLPFTVKNLANYYPPAALNPHTMGAANEVVQAIVLPNNTIIGVYMKTFNTTAQSAATNTDLATTTTIRVTVQYEIE